MTLKMNFENQFQTILPPLIIHSLIVFVLYMVNYYTYFKIPGFFKLCIVISISISFLCILFVHINYYLHEKNKSYLFDTDSLTVFFKNESFHYKFDEIRYIKVIESGYEMYDYRSFTTRRMGFFFPSYYFIEVILNNGNCIPISCFVDIDLSIKIKRLIPNKQIVEDLKAIPTI